MIQFHEDYFAWDSKTSQFYLDEAPTLIGDRVTREELRALRIGAGWRLTTTRQAAAGPLGQIDLWTRPG